jgi:small GTP-binding protein
MTSELEHLEHLGRRLAEAADSSSLELGARARRVTDRLRAGRFHVAVLGEFKRGKSTFINALLGRELLPTGVLPLTSVLTEVRHGREGATVVSLEGARHDVAVDEIADHVTEERNPANQLGVERVEVRVASSLLEAGVVLIDTPGLGSVYQHNTETGRAAILEADGAIVVLSADSPLSDHERELLGVLAERQARTFVVVNKSDHLDPADLETVRRFITEVVAAEFGRKPELYCLAARPALLARCQGREPGSEAVDFAAFAANFEDFVAADLVSARLDAARAELARQPGAARLPDGARRRARHRRGHARPKGRGAKIVLRQAPDQLGPAADLLGLTPAERGVVGHLVRGRALWKVGAHTAVVQRYLAPPRARDVRHRPVHAR